jgi:hypothetical protein
LQFGLRLGDLRFEKNVVEVVLNNCGQFRCHRCRIKGHRVFSLGNSQAKGRTPSYCSQHFPLEIWKDREIQPTFRSFEGVV